MADELRDPELEQVGAALRADRGECPPIDRLMAHARGELAAEEAVSVDRHLALCPDCQELAALAVESPDEAADVDDLTWRRAERRLDRRDSPWVAHRRPGRGRGTRLGLVAALLAAAVATGLWLGREPPSASTGGVSATRGTTLRPLEPVGEVEAPIRFRWQAPPTDLSYEVELERNGEIVWRGSSRTPDLAFPAELARRPAAGARQRWRVRALDAEGRTVLSSAWAEFVLTPTTP